MQNDGKAHDNDLVLTLTLNTYKITAVYEERTYQYGNSPFFRITACLQNQ